MQGFKSNLRLLHVHNNPDTQEKKNHVNKPYIMLKALMSRTYDVRINTVVNRLVGVTLFMNI